MEDKTVVKNSRGYLAWRRNLPFFIHNLYFTPLVTQSFAPRSSQIIAHGAAFRNVYAEVLCFIY